MGKPRRDPFGTLLSEILITGILLCALFVLTQVEHRLLRQASASSGAGPVAGEVQAPAPEIASTPDEEAQATFRKVEPKVQALVLENRFDEALRLLTSLPVRVSDTPTWKRLAQPFVRDIERQRDAYTAYQAALQDILGLIDRGAFDEARQRVDTFAHKQSRWYASLLEILADAAVMERAVAAVPGSRLGTPGDASGTGAEAGEPTPADLGPPADGPAALVEAPRRLGSALTVLLTPHWRLEVALPETSAKRLGAEIEVVTRIHQQLFSIPEKKMGKRTFRVMDSGPQEPAASDVEGVALTSDASESFEALAARAALCCAEFLLHEREGSLEMPGWIAAGLPRYMAMFEPAEKNRVRFRPWVDEYHDVFVRRAMDGALDKAVDVIGFGGERFGAAGLEKAIPVVEAWALVFFFVQSRACQINGLRERFVNHVRGLGKPGAKSFIDGVPEARAAVLDSWWHDYVVWGDVTRYEIKVRKNDGWRYVELPRLTILTEMAAEPFINQVSAFFQVMFQEFHRFYQDELGLFEKNIYKCRLRLFGSEESFNAHNQKQGKAGMRQHWDPGSNEVVMFNASGQFEENIPTLYHEFSHRFSQIYLPNIRTWTNEGLATYMGGTRRKLTHFEFGNVGGSLAVTRAAIKNGTALPLKVLTTLTYDEFHSSPDEALHYAQSCSLIHFIIHRQTEFTNEGKAREFFREAAAGRDDWHALEKVFGAGIDDIETQWRRHVQGWR